MEAAMQETQDKYEFRVRWKPFLLRPNMPESGAPKAPDIKDRVSQHLKAAGNSVGIDFTGKADIYPNTVKAHVLLELTKENPKIQDKLSEALFQAYFTDGSVLSDGDLVKIAESVGITREEAAAAIQDETKQRETLEAALSWSRRGVSGVPMFYINGQRTFSGAQDKNVFVNMFDVVAERFPLAAGLQ